MNIIQHNLDTIYGFYVVPVTYKHENNFQMFRKQFSITSTNEHNSQSDWRDPKQMDTTAKTNLQEDKSQSQLEQNFYKTNLIVTSLCSYNGSWETYDNINLEHLRRLKYLSSYIVVIN